LEVPAGRYKEGRARSLFSTKEKKGDEIGDLARLCSVPNPSDGKKKKEWMKRRTGSRRKDAARKKKESSRSKQGRGLARDAIASGGEDVYEQSVTVEVEKKRVRRSLRGGLEFSLRLWLYSV